MDGQALLAPLGKLTVGRIEAFIAAERREATKSILNQATGTARCRQTAATIGPSSWPSSTACTAKSRPSHRRISLASRRQRSSCCRRRRGGVRPHRRHAPSASRRATRDRPRHRARPPGRQARTLQHHDHRVLDRAQARRPYQSRRLRRAVNGLGLWATSSRSVLPVVTSERELLHARRHDRRRAPRAGHARALLHP